MATYLLEQNNTVGTWLTAAGYHTAYAGKYVNGMEAHPPSGWNHWGGFSTGKGTYVYEANQQWNITFDDAGKHPISPLNVIDHTGSHQATYLGQQAVAQLAAAQAKGRPAFIHLAPLMVHEGPCDGPFTKPEKYAYDDPGLEKFLNCPDGTVCSITISPCVQKANRLPQSVAYPRPPSWNMTSQGGPLPYAMQAAHGTPPLDDFDGVRHGFGYRNRTGSLADLDEVIGIVLDGIDALGLSDSTYVFFSSDNGEKGGRGKGQWSFADT